MQKEVGPMTGFPTKTAQHPSIDFMKPTESHTHLVTFNEDPVNDSRIPPFLWRFSGASGGDGDDGGGGDDHRQPHHPKPYEKNASGSNPKRVVGEVRELLFAQSDELRDGFARLLSKLNLFERKGGN